MDKTVLPVWPSAEKKYAYPAEYENYLAEDNCWWPKPRVYKTKMYTLPRSFYME